MTISIIIFILMTSYIWYMMSTDPDDYIPIEEPRRSKLMVKLKQQKRLKRMKRD